MKCLGVIVLSAFCTIFHAEALFETPGTEVLEKVVIGFFPKWRPYGQAHAIKTAETGAKGSAFEARNYSDGHTENPKGARIMFTRSQYGMVNEESLEWYIESQSAKIEKTVKDGNQKIGRLIAVGYSLEREIQKNKYSKKPSEEKSEKTAQFEHSAFSFTFGNPTIAFAWIPKSNYTYIKGEIPALVFKPTNRGAMVMLSKLPQELTQMEMTTLVQTMKQMFKENPGISYSEQAKKKAQDTLKNLGSIRKLNAGEIPQFQEEYRSNLKTVVFPVEENKYDAVSTLKKNCNQLNEFAWKIKEVGASMIAEGGLASGVFKTCLVLSFFLYENRKIYEPHNPQTLQPTSNTIPNTSAQLATPTGVSLVQGKHVTVTPLENKETSSNNAPTLVTPSCQKTKEEKENVNTHGKGVAESLIKPAQITEKQESGANMNEGSPENAMADSPEPPVGKGLVQDFNFSSGAPAPESEKFKRQDAATDKAEQQRSPEQNGGIGQINSQTNPPLLSGNIKQESEGNRISNAGTVRERCPHASPPSETNEEVEPEEVTLRVASPNDAGGGSAPPAKSKIANSIETSNSLRTEPLTTIAQTEKSVSDPMEDRNISDTPLLTNTTPDKNTKYSGSNQSGCAHSDVNKVVASPITTARDVEDQPTVQSVDDADKTSEDTSTTIASTSPTSEAPHKNAGQGPVIIKDLTERVTKDIVQAIYKYFVVFESLKVPDLEPGTSTMAEGWCTPEVAFGTMTDIIEPKTFMHGATWIIRFPIQDGDVATIDILNKYDAYLRSKLHGYYGYVGFTRKGKVDENGYITHTRLVVGLSVMTDYVVYQVNNFFQLHFEKPRCEWATLMAETRFNEMGHNPTMTQNDAPIFQKRTFIMVIIFPVQNGKASIGDILSKYGESVKAEFSRYSFTVKRVGFQVREELNDTGGIIRTRFIVAAITDEHIPANFLELSKLRLNVVAMIQMNQYLDKDVWRRPATAPTENVKDTDYLAKTDFISVNIFLNEENTIKPHFLALAEHESGEDDGASFAVYLKKNVKRHHDSIDTEMHTLYFIRCPSSDPDTSHVFKD